MKIKSIVKQITKDYDVVHFHIEQLNIPYIVTKYGNSSNLNELNNNIVSVSQDHATGYGSNSYVHNGLNWSEYTKPELSNKRSYFHFLGKDAWKVKM